MIVVHQTLDVVRILRRQRHDLVELAQRTHLLHERKQRVLIRHAIELVRDQQRGYRRRNQVEHLLVVRAEAAGFDHEQDRVDRTQRGRDRAVERTVQRAAVLGLETRRVDEDVLRVFQRMNAGDAMARGLRLARRDTDFLADQRVHQRGLADVRAADDRDHAAAKTSGSGSVHIRATASSDRTREECARRWQSMARIGDAGLHRVGYAGFVFGRLPARQAWARWPRVALRCLSALRAAVASSALRCGLVHAFASRA